MTSVVVLCDAAWPSWLGQEPWLSAWAPLRFADHARWIASRLEGLARCAVTFRAPNVAAKDGWRRGSRPPFRTRASADATSALDGMLVAHQRALEAIADAAPSLGRAILFEAMPAYDDAELWRDVARGIADRGALARRRRAWRQSVPRRGGVAERARRRCATRGAPSTSRALRSTGGWASTPSFEWWLGGRRRRAARDRTAARRGRRHDRRARRGSHRVGRPARRRHRRCSPRSPARCGRSTCTASSRRRDRCPTPVGLLEVEQHNASWSLGEPDPSVVRRLAGGWR